MSLPFEIEMRREEIRAEVEKDGAELVDLSFRHTSGRSILTFVVDRDGGVTLDECAEINRRLGAWFDELSRQYSDGQDFIKGAYYLEVNSPGLDRPLRTERDFAKAVGQSVRVTYRAEDGRSLDYEGEVQGAGEGVVRFSRGEEEWTLRIDSILKAVRQIKFGK